VGEEHEVQEDPLVIEGDDDVPRQPALPNTEFVPPHVEGPTERRAIRVMALAFIPILIVVGIVLWAALR
jgi:hypothetical protein